MEQNFVGFCTKCQKRVDAQKDRCPECNSKIQVIPKSHFDETNNPGDAVVFSVFDNEEGEESENNE